MKKRWMALFAASVLSGCVPPSFIVPPQPAATDKATEAARTTYVPPVTPSQINANNAQEKAEALRAEINVDMVGAVEVSSKDTNGKKDK